MANRTFGWIQNPGSLTTLKEVVGVFVKNSTSYNHVLNYKLPLIKRNNLILDSDYRKINTVLCSDNIIVPYTLAKGRGAGSAGRANALCSGLVQAVITAQKTITLIGLDGNPIDIKKPYTDDWTADGYLRWAVSTGLLNYDVNSDSCSVSELGKALVNATDNSPSEKKIFESALLMYPPVYRVLSILSDRQLHTKFEIGSRLGFKGELGFTSIPQNVYVYDYCSAGTVTERNNVRSNMEGDADKYARMISNWLVKLGWVVADRKEVTESYFDESFSVELEAWRITRAGECAIAQSNGNSSNRKIPKIVKYEMLASKISDCDYVRFRRANIINLLRTEKTIYKIQDNLKPFLLDESADTILDDIKNFGNIGLRIQERNGKYRLLDNVIELNIPLHINHTSKSEVSLLKERIRSKLKCVDHKYLVLVDLAYSDASTKQQKNLDAKEFEIETANLLKESGFRAERLGNSNRPDVLMEYGRYGTIIDNKSYKDGLNISAGLRDEMARYVEQNNVREPHIPPNEWWKWFNENCNDFRFLFVTSYLKGNFMNQLEYIYRVRQTKGGAVSVENLLYFAEAIKSGQLTKENFFGKFKNNEMICDIFPENNEPLSNLRVADNH